MGGYLNQQQQASQEQFAVQQQANLERQGQALVAAVPEWGKDVEVGRKAISNIKQGGVEHYGFTAPELETLTDARALLVLRDALAYRKLQASNPTVTKKLKLVPKAPLRAKATRHPDEERADDVSAARSKFRKNPNDDDAGAEVLRQMGL